jgi:hypothetical protein
VSPRIRLLGDGVGAGRETDAEDSNKNGWDQMRGRFHKVQQDGGFQSS